MEIFVISLFVTFALWSINIGFLVRFYAAKLTGKPEHYYLTKPLKPLDCFPCFAFWTALTVTLIAYLATGIFEYLPAMLVYCMANFYERYDP